MTLRHRWREATYPLHVRDTLVRLIAKAKQFVREVSETLSRMREKKLQFWSMLADICCEGFVPLT